MTARSIVLLSLLFVPPALVQGQDRTPAGSDPRNTPEVARVRTLYAAASYEEALAAIPAEPAGAALTELEQYRALCLLALGREADAIAAIERLVKTHPTYLPPEGEISPRVRAIFTEARTKLVPDVARETYADAKSAFEAKDADTARAGFKRTIDVIDSLPESEREALADLRLLATGFMDLVAARPDPPLPPPAPVENPLIGRIPAGAYVPPVPVREQLPPWIPPDFAARRTEYVGVLRIMIGEDGRVVNATMVQSSHPLYDAAAVRAARDWIYKPATRGGQPVVAQKDIQVRLLPR